MSAPSPAADTPALSPAEIIELRRKHLCKAQSLSYGAHPLKIVKGQGQYLFDHKGRKFVDCVNNVCHVGHCHPQVVAAAQAQLAELNTNTRYLHDNLVLYAQELTATFPEPLDVCIFVCTGSEANDLALRIAKTVTGNEDVLVMDAAYHGHTNALIGLSPYKYEGRGGQGPPPTTHKCKIPDGYRGEHRRGQEAEGMTLGQMYARDVQDKVDAITAQGRKPAAFFCESLLGCGGQIPLAEGFLKAAYGAVREAGGICIADEVQVGFGRVGSHMWGFETQGVVPDIVTLGKPIGNGFPMAAVVTTRKLADAFANGMEYFNTFGGNPVACAVGLAVLRVLKADGLQENAAKVGEHIMAGMRALAEHRSLVGDVRGMGLFVGMELVRNHETLEPADTEASDVVLRMRRAGFLLSTDGPLHNVLKLKPPLCFSMEDANALLRDLDTALLEAQDKVALSDSKLVSHADADDAAAAAALS